jgi:AraC-like DNA-binding protein
MTEKVPLHVDLDFGSLEPRHRFDAYQSFFENIDHVKLRDISPEAMCATATAWKVGPAMIGRYGCCSAYLVRDRPLLKKTVSEFALMRLYLSGSSRVIVGSHVTEMRPGTLFIWDVQCEFIEMTDGAVYISAGIPFSKIGFDPARHSSPLAFRGDTPAGRMLVSAFETMHAILPGSGSADSAMALDGFCALLKVILSGKDSGDGGFLAKGREIAVRRYLEAHWRDASLTAAKVCAELGMSRAVLYRLPFIAEAGGFDAFLRRLRLDAALIALTGHPPERGVVARISKQQGFEDQAGFARQFRRAFGCRPGEVVGLSVLGRQAGEEAPAQQLPAGDGRVKTLMSLYAA